MRRRCKLSFPCDQYTYKYKSIRSWCAPKEPKDILDPLICFVVHSLWLVSKMRWTFVPCICAVFVVVCVSYIYDRFVLFATNFNVNNAHSIKPNMLKEIEQTNEN